MLLAYREETRQPWGLIAGLPVPGVLFSAGKLIQYLHVLLALLMLTISKPGECPPQTSGTLCTTSCNSDSNCPDNEKCCSNGCGSYCTAPYTVKPGQCPKPKSVPECAESCFHDGQCPATQKCCPTTCGHVCSELRMCSGTWSLKWSWVFCMMLTGSFQFSALFIWHFPCFLKPFKDFLSAPHPHTNKKKKKNYF
uniref:WAP domain-containing protein n=1 Tax=Cyprinus carpio carpio TaxID=630221 RepID=A0A8C1BN24_CYPCA